MSNNKRSLESPEQDQNSSKIIKVLSNAIKEKSSTTMINGTEGNTADNVNSGDILSAIRSAVADEFKIFKTQHIQPIVEDVSEIKKELVRLKEERGMDREKIHLLERELKQKNLIFTRMPRTDNCEKSISDLCTRTLGLNEEITIDKVVVLKRTATDNTLTLLSSFSSQKTVEAILRNAKKLKGTGIGISRDLGTEDREARKHLMNLRKLIREKDTSQIIRVYGNQIIFNDIKFTLTRSFFGNKQKNINARTFILEKFNIDCNEVFIQ